nr:immunoglobulin heavy chain junction region [Macaca mulatta]MOV56480.1 immunoglobulin heavy chain junction region [Macaca mulatta]MOV56989.1 immunoglobulin heavy chain junction region [Macaca mulatta]MOV60034.1 immunoglobulin heavy chain junction region [Macaca mulatta]MOV60550.1 immunoglobulin heavy chain junction region [Macaca mulatta]
CARGAGGEALYYYDVGYDSGSFDYW